MKTYRVKCGYRIASNFPACTPLPTHYDIVTVSVDDPKQAPFAAINALYMKHPNAEHVQPCLVLRED